MHLWEKGVLVDNQKAFFWLKKAGDQHHSGAQYCIGIISFHTFSSILFSSRNHCHHHPVIIVVIFS